MTTPADTTTPEGGGTTTVFAIRGPLFFDVLSNENEMDLTYEEFIGKRVNEFYENNPNIFNDKTNEEKEEIILNLVGDGELSADVAVEIANREGLDV